MDANCPVIRHASASAVVIWSTLAAAQEMEPRSYSASRSETNFIVMDYARSSGDILFDPSLPVTDLQAKINTYSLGLSHSFGVLGHEAGIAIAVPYANANLTGNVEGAPGHAYRSGSGTCNAMSATVSRGHFRFQLNGPGSSRGHVG